MTRRTVLLALCLSACAGNSTWNAGKSTDLQGVVGLLMQQTDGGRHQPIPAGRTLHSGDRLNIVAQVTQPAFLYVVQETGNHALSMLVPGGDAPLIKAELGQVLNLPSDGTWFQLDQQTGEESLYLVASEQSLDASSVFHLIRSDAFERVRDPPPIVGPKDRGIRFRTPEERAAARCAPFSAKGTGVLRLSYRHE